MKTRANWPCGENEVKGSVLIAGVVSGNDFRWFGRFNRLRLTKARSGARKHPKLAPRFQSVIEVLLTANRDDFFNSGTQLLSKHERIIPDVKRSLGAWREGRPDTDQRIKIVSDLCNRPDLS